MTAMGDASAGMMGDQSAAPDMLEQFGIDRNADLAAVQVVDEPKAEEPAIIADDKSEPVT
jgi:hypothetical protein